MKNTLKKALILVTAAMMVIATAVPAAAATETAITSVSFPTVKTVNVGQSQTLTVTTAPAKATNKTSITWTLDAAAKKIINYKANGTGTLKSKNSSITITGKAAGTGTITTTIKTYNNAGKVLKTFTKKTKVTVVKAIPAKTAVSHVSTTECYNTLNQYRKKVGKAALKRDANLEKYAEIRARELVVNFSHTRPDGTKGLRIIPGNIYKGENIAKGQRTCASVMTAWYNSAGHRDNMLDKNYKKVGIACIKYNGTMYWVQLFSS